MIKKQLTQAVLKNGRFKGFVRGVSLIDLQIKARKFKVDLFGRIFIISNPRCQVSLFEGNK